MNFFAGDEKINTPSLVEVVRERLIGDIIRQHFKSGDKLRILEIAERYGVSETPVKQAFNRLISEGMLESVPRRGVIVRKISKEEVKELMEARQVLNLASIDAALSRTGEERGKMKNNLERELDKHYKLLEDVRRELNIHVYLRYGEIDKHFHAEFLKCFHNTTIERIYNNLRDQSYSYISLSEIVAGRIEKAYYEHRKIFNMWNSGNRQGLIDAFNHHKDGALSFMEEVFRKERR